MTLTNTSTTTTGPTVPAAKKFASQRSILAKISLNSGQTVTGLDATSFSDQFAQVSGGEITASVEKIYRGGSTFPETLCAPSEIGDITLTDFVEYEAAPAATGSFYSKMQILRQYVGRIYFDISVKTYDCDLAVPGSERLYTKALLVGLTEADGDASSGAPATFALTFSISTIAPSVINAGASGSTTTTTTA
jgi:hypothetical protein